MLEDTSGLRTDENQTTTLYALRPTAMSSLAPLTDVFRTLWPSTTRHQRHDHHTAERIRRYETTLRTESDLALASRVQSLRERILTGLKPTEDDAIIPGFALVIEAARRSIGIDYYDVQILAGLTLTRGFIAEMATGEGKTFVAAFPAFMHALTAEGVHVFTVNSYLAERDSAIMSPLFGRLNLSVGLLRAGATPDEKRSAYHCDITYGPGYEFGFDYLRDQLALFNTAKPTLGDSFRGLMRNSAGSFSAFIQRDRAFAVVDEADSVMIDEATTPLVLSGRDSHSTHGHQAYLEARRIAQLLTVDVDFAIDHTARQVRLTDTGLSRAAAHASTDALRGLERPWPCYVEQALFASTFLHRDAEYVVSDGKVVLVDEFTGRLFSDRTLREGLHQAVEAKEGLAITPETQPLARILRQRFLQLYRGLCGMTGTAIGGDQELRDVYSLSVTQIPTRLPCRRETYPTRYFACGHSKWKAIVQEIDRMHRTNRPLLVGTRTIEASEKLALQLRERKLPFQLLNGRQDEQEARIIAHAGQAGTITIATNMAGRGTDIKLGPGVTDLGGLHVIGTERHESARVDRQLAGRAARQGDPGSCQFFVSADDYLIVRYGSWLSETMKNLLVESGEITTDLSRQVATVQKDAERLAYARREQLFRHDNWQEGVLDRLASEGKS